MITPVVKCRRPIPKAVHSIKTGRLSSLPKNISRPRQIQPGRVPFRWPPFRMGRFAFLLCDDGDGYASRALSFHSALYDGLLFMAGDRMRLSCYCDLMTGTPNEVSPNQPAVMLSQNHINSVHLSAGVFSTSTTDATYEHKKRTSNVWVMCTTWQIEHWKFE